MKLFNCKLSKRNAVECLLSMIWAKVLIKEEIVK